jgi:hypothetical protein
MEMESDKLQKLTSLAINILELLNVKKPSVDCSDLFE